MCQIHFEFFICGLGVGFTPEHVVTIEAGQGDPNGPELSIPDSSLLGRPIKIEKSTSSKKK
jgi:hypothetical protein